MTIPDQIRLMTAEEFAALPPDGNVYDLVGGMLVLMSRPTPLHGRIQARLARFVTTHVNDNDLGDVTTESGYLLARDPDVVHGPDLAYLSNESKRRLVGRASSPYPEIAPDLVVESVSPGDTARDVLKKIGTYFRAGTRLMWVVYPEERKVYVYQSADQVSIVPADGTLDGGDVLPGFRLHLREVFKGLDSLDTEGQQEPR